MELPASTIFEPLKRARDADDDAEQPTKQKRVRFSDTSSTRYFEISPLHTDSSGCGSAERDGVSFRQVSEDGHSTPSILPSLPQTEVTKVEADELEIRTPTKTQDGPSADTLATQRIIRFIIKQRKINRHQITSLLREAACDHSNPPSLANIQHDACFNIEGRPTEIGTSLYHAVSRRLRALGDRIEERGKVSMLPCASNLGPAFLRPLRLLENAVALCVDQAIDRPGHSLMARG
jgi:hypothetical protein